METTLDFLDRLKAAHDDCSDYRAAQILGISKNTVYSWKEGHVMSDKTGITLAEIMDISPGYVLACLHAESSKDDRSSQVWAEIAKTLSANIAA